MAESHARNRFAEAVVRSADAEPEPRAGAGGMVREPRDVAAVRMALGQPRGLVRARAVPVGDPPAAQVTPAIEPDLVAPRPVAEVTSADGAAEVADQPRTSADGAVEVRGAGRRRRRVHAVLGTLVAGVLISSPLAHERSTPPRAEAPLAVLATAALPRPARLAGLALPPPSPSEAEGAWRGTDGVLAAPEPDQPMRLAAEPTVRVSAEIVAAVLAAPAVPPAWRAAAPMVATLPGRIVVAGLTPPVTEPSPPPGRIPEGVGEVVPPPARPAPVVVEAEGTRVVIHYHRGVAREMQQGLTASLRQGGFGRVEWRAVGNTVSRTQTRYFHPGDRALSDRAVSVLAALHRPADGRDFTHYVPAARIGTVEVWLSD